MIRKPAMEADNARQLKNAYVHVGSVRSHCADLQSKRSQQDRARTLLLCLLGDHQGQAKANVQEATRQ